MFGRKGLGAAGSGAPTARFAGARETGRQPFSGVEVSFSLKSHKLLMLCGIFASAICSVLFLGGLAHPGGVVINRAIPLGPLGADLFWGLLFLASLWGLGGSTRGFIAAFGPPRCLVLDHHAISGPASPTSRKVVRIGWTEIVQTRLQALKGSYFLTIKAPGKTLRVGDANFADKQEFMKLLSALEQRLAH